MINTNTKIYIANLGKYNEGELVGEWIDLPFSDDDLHELFVRIGLGQITGGVYTHGIWIDGVCYEEYAIHDYETELEGLKIGEYENLDELNELIEEYEKLEEYQGDIVASAIECFGYSLKEALERVNDFNLLSDVHNEYDLGYYWAVESGCYDLDKMGNLKNYFDYEAFGRDINLETSGGFTSKGYIEETR